MAGVPDQLPNQIVDERRAQTTRQLAHRGFVRDALVDREQTEAAQVEGVADLSHEGLVAPPGPVLDHHQAQVDGHRDRGSAVVAGCPVPVRAERLEHGVAVQELVEPGQILGQAAQLRREQGVPDGGDGMRGGESQHGGLRGALGMQAWSLAVV